MSISTQKIEIYEDVNPLESKIVEIPVHKKEVVMCHEPYVLESLKMYNQSCTDEVMDAINAYESAGKFRDVREGLVSSYDAEKSVAEIDLSAKHGIMVDINPNETIKSGDKIDVVVTKARGKLYGDASSKTAQIEKLRQELIREIQAPTSAYSAEVKEIVYNAANAFNGFMVDIKGIRCFMPGTESDVVPVNDFNEMVGKTLYVMPINQIKESIVVSHKEYLNTLKPNVLDKLQEAGKDTLVTGVISSVKHFGVFILIDSCVATLLSASEMNDETESKFKAGQLKIGDAIEFYIDSINDDRVIVTQTASKSEGWDRLKEAVTQDKDYKLKGIVKNLFENGVVVYSEEFNGITFFLSSKVVDLSNLTPGGEIILPVDNVDTVKKTVRLKID